MKFENIMTSTLLIMMSLPALAKDQLIICEGEGAASVHAEFRSVQPGYFEAVKLNYNGENVIDDPRSIFNHLGIILFRGKRGIEFHASENSDDFYVTVKSFGGEPLKNSQGKCVTIDTVCNGDK